MMKSRMLEINSRKIAYYESSGSGCPVLFIHGNSYSAIAFRHQLESSLGKKFHFMAIDLPGHGLSEPANDPLTSYTFPGYAETVVTIVKKLGIHQGVFVGWSLGGHILIEAISELTEAYGFLIFGTPPIDVSTRIEDAFLPNPSLRYYTLPELKESEIEEAVTIALSPEIEEVPDMLKADIRRTDKLARKVLNECVSQGKYKNEVAIVSDLRVPIAILHGKNDQIVSYEYIRKLKIPTLWHENIQVIPNSGHMPQWEQPGLFNKLLEEFIEDLTT